MKPAVIVVDMQKGFVRGGKLRADLANVLIQNVRHLVEKAREMKVPIIYTQDSHYPGIDFEVKFRGEHTLCGTEGTNIVPELTPKPSDYVIKKRRYDGFFETGLDLLLRELGVDTLILTGITAHICVMHTACGAFYKGYGVTVAEDCVVSFTEEDKRMSLDYIRKNYAGKIESSDAVIKGLREKIGAR